MAIIQKSALVPYSAKRMFVLVDDVHAYPQFLPWCGGTKVVNNEDATVSATIMIDYHGIKQSFTTRNTRVEGETIDMKLQDGPFKRLEGIWRFVALAGDAGCKVELALDYTFSNSMLERAVGPVFEMIAGTMIERFVARADSLFTPPTGGAATAP
jgi:ribosome-associated toxin RatA of RatAB toxin-antitoxin module